jgi:uncharacterized protein (DUF1684 family)
MHKLNQNVLRMMLSIFTVAFFSGCNQHITDRDESEYISMILEERSKHVENILDSATSRFNEEEREMFAKKAPAYFDPDISYKVTAHFTVDTSFPVFQMPTTTDRKPNYRIYGYLDFKVKDTSCRLTVYQNYDYKDHPEHGNYLFIPFKDNTSEFSTYGGGRYMDIPIPETETVTVDFNTCYNPLCAYATRWSCPLVPMNNALEIALFAGEMKYK